VRFRPGLVPPPPVSEDEDYNEYRRLLMMIDSDAQHSFLGFYIEHFNCLVLSGTLLLICAHT
jgi:hypothetical protein